MDTSKIISLVILAFLSVEVKAAAFSFSIPSGGALYNSPGGVMGSVYKGSQTAVENGRMRSSPPFTFNTAEGKKVGFTASRLSNIATSRVGSAVVAGARVAGPIGMGIFAADLICTNTSICQDALDQWNMEPEFDPDLYPSSLGVGQYTIGGVSGSYPSAGSVCTAYKDVFPADTESISWSTSLTSDTVCESLRNGEHWGDTAIGFAPTGCATDYSLIGGGCELQGSNEASAPTDADWDNAAPLLNDDAFAQPLLDAGQPVPVDVPDVMTPQNFISDSQTTTLRDSGGNITGSQVTEREVSITDISDANDPNKFDITEKKTVTNYDVNNNVVNSETTIINNEQPTQPEEEEITFDTVEPEVLLFKDITIPLDVTPWGSGTCPGDLDIATSFQAFTFNVTPLCDFAVAVKPFILLIASITGAMIMIGAHRATS